MIAVIFEVLPTPGEGHEAYLEHAARIRPTLEKMDGFISIERFQSLSREGKLVSLSFWRDEDCVRRWREHPEHRKVQVAGRNGVFQDYRLRVAEVVRDYGLHEREQAPPGHEPIPARCPLPRSDLW
jgi:heme-degrading monooxygenase HmoA